MHACTLHDRVRLGAWLLQAGQCELRSWLQRVACRAAGKHRTAMHMLNQEYDSGYSLLQ